MRKGGRRSPLQELRVPVQRIRGYELYGGVGKVFALVSRQEHGAVVRATQKAAQGKQAIDNPALPVGPDFRLRDSSRFHTHAGDPLLPVWEKISPTGGGNPNSIHTVSVWCD